MKEIEQLRNLNNNKVDPDLFIMDISLTKETPLKFLRYFYLVNIVSSFCDFQRI